MLPAQKTLDREEVSTTPLAFLDVSVSVSFNSWMNSRLRELTGALFMETVARPLSSTTTSTLLPRAHVLTDRLTRGYTVKPELKHFLLNNCRPDLRAIFFFF